MNDQLHPSLPQWQVQWRHERPRQRCGLQRRSCLQRGVHRAPASARCLPAADAEVAHTKSDAALTARAAQSARGRAVRPRAGPVQPPLSTGLAVEQLQVRCAALLSVLVTPALRVPGRRCGRECRTCRAQLLSRSRDLADIFLRFPFPVAPPKQGHVSRVAALQDTTEPGLKTGGAPGNGNST